MLSQPTRILPTFAAVVLYVHEAVSDLIEGLLDDTAPVSLIYPDFYLGLGDRTYGDGRSRPGSTFAHCVCLKSRLGYRRSIPGWMPVYMSRSG